MSSVMPYYLFSVAVLHAGFMMAELLPWRTPALLRVVSKKLSPSASFTDEQRRLVATIVHNAGIYNGIMAGGLLWAAFAGAQGQDVARVLLVGAVVAGVFGTLTLKSPVTALQALVSVPGLFL